MYRLIKSLSRLSIVIALALTVTTCFAQQAWAATATTEATRMNIVKARGDAEISRRLRTLSTLSTRITSAAHLSAGDKTTLSNEVDAEITGLGALKTKLASETSLTAVVADAQSILTEYRVYALLVPKVALIKTADSQQAVEMKLSDLATKLQARLDSAKANGKDTTDLQAQLDTLKTTIADAQTTSISVQSKVVALQPTDYNNDHTILLGYRDQLRVAHTNNQIAVADARSIIAALKNL